MQLKKDPACPICGENPTVTELIDYEHFCGVDAFFDSQDALDADARISATELNALRQANPELYILDVREPHEYDICHIEGAHLIPLGELERHLDQLSRDEQIVVHCRSGQRSANAVKFLREAGFDNTQNLTGGILAWAEHVDKDMPKY